MSNKPVLAAFFLAAVGVAAGSTWAATDNAQTSEQAAATKDFGKLSAAGGHGFMDLKLARLAIYDGQTAQAKTYADQAAKLFANAKSDDAAFVKAEADLMTPSQLAAKKGAKSGEAQPAASASTEKVAWLPVDGAMDINENYTLNPAKMKAVTEANKSIAKGDRKGAVEQLKLAGIDTSIVVEVVPRDQTISDVQQAAQMIDSGKYYEGSQMLRKVEVAARYDLTDIVTTPKTAAAQPTAQSAQPAAKTADAAKTNDTPKAN